MDVEVVFFGSCVFVLVVVDDDLVLKWLLWMLEMKHYDISWT